MTRRTSVVYRSRGRNTRQETYRPKSSWRTNSRVRRRSCSWSTPRLIRVRVSTSEANSSSRGYVSRMVSRSLPEWLRGPKPLVASTVATLRSTTGTEDTLWV